MKIQDVFEPKRDEDKAAMMQKHQELMKEMREKKEKKVEKNKNSNEVKSGKNDLSRDANIYLESLERMKAASIAARIARGEDVAKAQRDFLNSNYPDMLSDATVVKNRINMIMKKLRSSSSKKEAEEILQKLDVQTISLPFGDEQSTVFDKAVEIINQKM